MSKFPNNEKLEYLLEIDRQILESIQFADRKSSIYLTISGAMLAFLIKAYPLSGNFPKSFCDLSEILILFTYLSTVLTMVSLSIVIWPKGFNTRKTNGFFDPIRIAKFCCPHTYRQSYLDADDSLLMENACELVFDRSKINDRKYRRLKIGLMLSYCSWALTAAVFILLPIKDKCVF